MSSFIEKYNQLDDVSKQKLNTLLDLLLQETKVDKQNDLKEYKLKIKDVSVWSDEDLNYFAR